MSSRATTRKNDVYQNSIEDDDEEISINVSNNRRSSLVPRQISFSQRRATNGEIILVILPYLVLIFDIFLFFLLRGFKLRTFNEPILPDSNPND